MKMPPKKLKMTKDIRSFFGRRSESPGRSCSGGDTQPGGAAAWQAATPTPLKVKKENDGDCVDGHKHDFTVKFGPRDCTEYTIHCFHPCTVLEAIRAHEKSKKMKCADENIIIEMGKGDKEYIIATHFPCTCIKEGESLTVSCKSEKIEKVQDQHYDVVSPKEKYSVFYIDTKGGLNTRSKELFRNSKVIKQFEFLCVYGEMGTTVQEALRRDGRFVDDLGHFELSHNKVKNRITVCTDKVDSLHQKKFKIRLPLNNRENDDKEKEIAPNISKRETRSVLDAAQQRGNRVKTVLKETDGANEGEIYELLRQQFPGLKQWMESRFPGDSYQEALDLRKENFGKIQKSFSEVHRLKKLFKLGESVCKVVVTDVCVGTAFVLFGNFILTNAHLFKGHVKEKKLDEDIKVSALFNYDDPEPITNFNLFTAKNTFVDIDVDLDYAILELDPEGQKHNQQSNVKNVKVPPGLLDKFGPLPVTGEACIIGHPAGEVKQIDPTCIIEKDKRVQAVDDHLRPYKDNLFTLFSISQTIRNQGIETILQGGKKAENVAAYHTFMYHGASGSPVFDGLGRVFGLHTAGFYHGFPNHKEHVIEYAQPLLTIFEKFVGNLKKNGNKELLERVEEVAKKNLYLKEILHPEPADPEESMDDS